MGTKNILAWATSLFRLAICFGVPCFTTGFSARGQIPGETNVFYENTYSARSLHDAGERGK